MITLRAPEQTDVDSIFLWENDPGFNESLPQSAPLSRYQVWEYIKNYQADPFSTRELRMMINASHYAVVGHIDMFDFDPVNRRAESAFILMSRVAARAMPKRLWKCLRLMSYALSACISYGLMWQSTMMLQKHCLRCRI